MPRARSIIAPTIHSDTEAMKPRAGLRHQHAVAARGGQVDVADVDGAAHEGLQLRQRGEQRLVAHGLAVGDDGVAVARQFGDLVRQRSRSSELKRTCANARSALLARSPK